MSLLVNIFLCKVPWKGKKKYRNVKLKMMVSRKEKNILMTLIVTAVRTFRRNKETELSDSKKK